MGSWSVYCGISNISIVSGHECCLLPIQKNKEYVGYLPYLPLSLPIFGKYNDYGDLENIVEDANTKLIEARYGLSIEDYCKFLTNREYYDVSEKQFDACRSELNSMMGELTDGMLKELTSTNFMWIDRQVYDAMIENNNTYYKGHNDYGTPEMLELLGFELLEESKTFNNYDPRRFDKKYANKDGVEVYSDGRTLLSTDTKNRYIYDFGKGTESSIETNFKVDSSLDYLKELGEHESWRILNKTKQIEKLGYVFGKTLVDEYFNDMESFGDDMAKMVNFRQNLHCMSGLFKPFENYLTPQCGEFEEHQNLLDKFAEINRGYIYTD